MNVNKEVISAELCLHIFDDITDNELFSVTEDSFKYMSSNMVNSNITKKDFKLLVTTCEYDTTLEGISPDSKTSASKDDLDTYYRKPCKSSTPKADKFDNTKPRLN